MHQDNTQKTADTVVADTKYGTVENYLTCCDLGVNAHIPDLKKASKKEKAVEAFLLRRLSDMIPKPMLTCVLVVNI
jgi:hypothetical protein